MARTLWTSEVFVGWSVFLSTLIRYKRDLARSTRGKNSFVYSIDMNTPFYDDFYVSNLFRAKFTYTLAREKTENGPRNQTSF